MIANYNGTGTITTGTSFYYPFSPYSNYSNYIPQYEPPRTRRERELAELQRELKDEIKKFGKQCLVLRIARMEKERKVMSDARSRSHYAPKSTKRRDGRRMQTYDAAMAMRQLRR